jgi:hypothetical protein
LKQDNRLVIQAAAAAQEAVDMIIGENFVEEDRDDRGAGEDGTKDK